MSELRLRSDSQKKSPLAELVLRASGDVPHSSRLRTPAAQPPAHATLWHEEQAAAAEREAAAAQKAAGVPLGRKILNTISNLDANLAPALVHRPSLKPEAVDPNSPRGRVRSFVGRIIGGGTR